MSKARPTSSIDTIIIHCAATPNGACWCAEDIDDWHKERGFGRDYLRNVSRHLKHIGYHFVIETTGDLRRGRALDETGAHARGHNQTSIGICLIGTDKYTIDQWQTLKTLVASLKTRFPVAAVIGHRDVNPDKTCPGFDVQSWLASGMSIPDGHWLDHRFHLTDA